jgi:hypothetical protein
MFWLRREKLALELARQIGAWLRCRDIELGKMLLLFRHPYSRPGRRWVSKRAAPRSALILMIANIEATVRPRA